MFGTLIESKPATERSLGQTLFSLTVHGALLVGAVHATQGAAAEVRARLVDSTAVYIRPIDPAEVVHAAPAAPSSSAVPAGPTFETVTAPIDIPIGIPPVDLGESFDPSRFTGTGTEGPAKPLIGSGATGDPGAIGSGQFSPLEVDVPVHYLGGGEPVYPPALRKSGVAGEVTLQFVVNADGKVEPESVRVIGSTLYGFEAAAREAILRARFEPATIRGKAVRQLVQQRVRFEVR
ncbi:MAG: energy transducer TonB [Gemmatimonadetes bacterium]|nr:energy transducer TonB [Gemmatimonadota bacterium]